MDKEEARLEKHRAGIRARTREARRLTGRNTADMARVLGVSQAAYKKYEERHKSVIPTELIARFCSWTGVSGEWLIGLTGTQNRPRRR